MHSNDLEACGKKCCCFWFHFEVITRFDVFLDLVILPYFNAICNDFYAVKCLIYIYFVWFPCFLVEERLYKDLNALRILMNFLCIYLG